MPGATSAEESAPGRGPARRPPAVPLWRGVLGRVAGRAASASKRQGPILVHWRGRGELRGGTFAGRARSLYAASAGRAPRRRAGAGRSPSLQALGRPVCPVTGLARGRTRFAACPRVCLFGPTCSSFKGGVGAAAEDAVTTSEAAQTRQRPARPSRFSVSGASVVVVLPRCSLPQDGAAARPQGCCERSGQHMAACERGAGVQRLPRPHTCRAETGQVAPVPGNSCRAGVRRAAPLSGFRPGDDSPSPVATPDRPQPPTQRPTAPSPP